MGNPTDYVEVDDLVEVVKDLYNSNTFEYEPGAKDALISVLEELDISVTRADLENSND
jgi:hypothetical protein